MSKTIAIQLDNGAVSIMRIDKTSAKNAVIASEASSHIINLAGQSIKELYSISRKSMDKRDSALKDYEAATAIAFAEITNSTPSLDNLEKAEQARQSYITAKGDFQINANRLALASKQKELKKKIVHAAYNKIVAESAVSILEKKAMDSFTERKVRAGVSVIRTREITEDKIPTDYTFRNAWTDDKDTDTIDVDMVKARPIHMDVIRGLRKEKLKDLDIQFARALEQSDTKEINKIAEQRQILFDLPTTYDLSKYHTPEALKEAIPKEVL